MRLSWYHVGLCLLVFDIIQSDLIFSMVDESLDRLSRSQYRDRAESLDALCGKCRLVAVSVGEHVSFLWKRFFEILGLFRVMNR